MSLWLFSGLFAVGILAIQAAALFGSLSKELHPTRRRDLTLAAAGNVHELMARMDKVFARLALIAALLYAALIGSALFIILSAILGFSPRVLPNVMLRGAALTFLIMPFGWGAMLCCCAAACKRNRVLSPWAIPLSIVVGIAAIALQVLFFHVVLYVTFDVISPDSRAKVALVAVVFAAWLWLVLLAYGAGVKYPWKLLRQEFPYREE